MANCKAVCVKRTYGISREVELGLVAINEAVVEEELVQAEVAF